MGYESRIKIVALSKELNWADDLCTMNLCCMDWDVNVAFPNTVDFDVYFHTIQDIVFDDFQPTVKDMYGKELRYTTVDELIKYLKLQQHEYYRREDVLLQTLRAYKDAFTDEKELLVVHFGY